MRLKSFSILSLFLSIGLFLFPAAGPAQETPEPPIEDPVPIPDPIDPPADNDFPGFTNIRIQYAAQFTCGSNPTATPRVLPGQYATSVNILNPKESPAVFRKRVALTFPPPTQEAGMVSDPIEDELGPLEALKVACDEIPSQFFPGVTDLPPYVHGFLIIESGRKLNVTTVYTTGTAEGVQSIDVEAVRGRLVKN